MGRFYETAQRNFVDDFIYQPPWEMAMAAMGKADQDVQMSLDTMELMRNLPVDYWKGVDDSRADTEKQKWAEKIDGVSENIRKDLLNPANKAQLANLRTELSRDMSSGNLYKLQQNANAYKELMAKAALIKDDDTRAKYLEGLPKEYLAGNPDGAYGTTFKPGELYQQRDVAGEFIDYFREQKPDVFNSTMENTNGRWITKNTNETTQNLVNDQFKEFIQAHPDVKGYMKHRQDSKIFGETYFNETGELNINPSSTFSAMNKLVQNESYTQKKTAKEISTDQYGVMAQNEAYNIAGEKRAEKSAMAAARATGDDSLSPIVSSDKNIDWYYKYTKEGQAVQASLNTAIRQSLNDLPPKERAEAAASPGSFFKKVLKDPTSPLYAKYNMLNTMYSKQAGDSKFVALGTSSKTLDLIAKKLNDKKTTNALRTSPGYLNMGQVNEKNVKPILLNQMVGKTITREGKKYYVKALDLQEGSHYLDGSDMHISSTVNMKLIPYLNETSKALSKDGEIEVPYDFEQPNVAGKVGISLDIQRMK